MIRHLLQFVRVLAGRVPSPVACDDCADRIDVLSRRDADIFIAHRRLLCPCGGSMFSIYRTTGGSR